MVSFRYFLGPPSEMLHLAPSPVECAFCSKVGFGYRCLHCGELAGNWDFD